MCHHYLISRPLAEHDIKVHAETNLQTNLYLINSQTTNIYSWERYQLVSQQSSESVEQNGVFAQTVRPNLPNNATSVSDVVPICAVSSYWMQDDNDDVAWYCYWDNTSEQFRIAAYHDEGRDFIEFTLILLDKNAFQLVDSQFFNVCGTNSAHVYSGNIDLADAIPIITVNQYETATDNDFMYFLKGTPQNFAVVTARGNDESCLSGNLYWIAPQSGIVGQYNIFNSPEHETSNTNQQVIVDLANSEILAFTSLIGYQTGPITVLGDETLDSTDVSATLDGGELTVEIEVVIDFSDNFFDDDFSGRSNWAMASDGSNLIFEFETAKGNANTRAIWQYIVFQETDLVPEAGTQNIILDGGSSNIGSARADTVQYTNQGLTGYEILGTTTPSITLQNNQGALQVQNPGAVLFDIFDADSDVFVTSGIYETQQFGLRGGNYYVRQQGQRVLEFLVARGQTTSIELDTGILAVSNPGAVLFDIVDASSDAYVTSGIYETQQFGLLSGSYYIKQNGEVVASFTITRSMTTTIQIGN